MRNILSLRCFGWVILLFIFIGIFFTSTATADTSAPEVENYTISNDTFRPGETMEINVNATDETNISLLRFRFQNTESGDNFNPFEPEREFDPPVENGTYTISYSWPENTPNGTYEITLIMAQDSLGNYNSYSDDLPGERQITINANTTDTDAPEVENYTISNDTFQPGETMEIDVNATDETNISLLRFRFQNTESGDNFNPFEPEREFDPPVENGTYTISYSWPENTPNGTYEITLIMAQDSLGNYNSYSDDLPGERQITIVDSTDGGGSDDDDSGDGGGPITTTATETIGSEAPGFGPLITLIGILAVAGLALRQRD
jgi:PGF-CTERM protein